jgi:uncharacterized FAD-dependent dehydrogenase
MESISFQCSPEQAQDEQFIENKLRADSGIKYPKKIFYRWKKKSIDARGRNIKINCTFDVADTVLPSHLHDFNFLSVANAPPITIIGAGPAGLFAALRCLELNLKPIIYERGKDVRSRRHDLAKLNKEGILNPESNYCFGEGGAGTYSDGKLYTRSKKRGDVEKVLQLLVHFGAEDAILVDAHPHIGTNKLPQIIEAIREKIIEFGGEIHFNSRLTDIKIEQKQLNAIQINKENWKSTKNMILATGHSARDIFYLLHDRKIRIESKPFALGVRIEHQQSFIDKLQYHNRENDQYLPPASYSLVAQIDGKGVYSFCMCPGGIIAPCATSEQEVVTNGWSPSKRNNPYANSGIVVSIDPSDFKEYKTDPFVCLDFQKSIEKACWEAAGENQKVPAQGLADFIDRKKTINFPKTSYFIGITSVEMDTVFPAFVIERIRKACLEFEKKMPGFITNDAVIHAPESRTSSPVLIPRNPETLEHVDVDGIYPCAEGAGYAGGIVSAAIDGMRAVNAFYTKIENV